MFGISQIKADLVALESKVSVEVRAEITTLGAKLDTLKSGLLSAIASLEARVKLLETPASAPPAAPKT